MKRPILIITLGYILGIWGACFNIIMLPILFIYPIYILINKKIKNYYIKFYINKASIIIFIISIIISNIITLFLNYKYDNLYKNIDEAILEGTIISRKIEKEYNNIYKIKVNKINKETKFKNTYLYLYTKKDTNLEYGNLIKTKIKFSFPSTQRNYKGFNYKEYLKTIKVYGQAISEENITLIKNKNINLIYYYSNLLNEKLQKNINNNFSKKESSILIGMLLGDKQFIDEDIINNFRISSLSHILAISGAHVSYVILLITFLLKKTNISNKKVKILCIIFLIFFMFLTGMQISVIRAVISAVLILIASLFYRQSDTLNCLCFSLIIILINNPFSINSLSLQLSFGGTIGIILLSKFLNKKENSKIIYYIKNTIFISICCQIIIFPIILKNFGTINLLFIFSNLFISPILGITIILGLLFCIISLISIKISFFISFILKIFLKIIIYIPKIFSQISFSEIYQIVPSTYIFYIYYFFILYTVRFQNLSNLRKKRIFKNIKKYTYKVITILLIFIILFNVLKFKNKNLKIYFIDVGQR